VAAEAGAAAHRGGIDSAVVVEPAGGGVLNGRGELEGMHLCARATSAKKINESNYNLGSK
jgi:hypothetical protein